MIYQQFLPNVLGTTVPANRNKEEEHLLQMVFKRLARKSLLQRETRMCWHESPCGFRLEIAWGGQKCSPTSQHFGVIRIGLSVSHQLLLLSGTTIGKERSRKFCWNVVQAERYWLGLLVKTGVCSPRNFWLSSKIVTVFGES